MKIHIEVVTGFLGAGKTTFINSLLSESQVEGEKVIIFQLEHGEREINKGFNIKIEALNEVRDLKEKMIKAINKYKPNRIIIEYNGTSDLKELFNILREKTYAKCSKITTIFFVANGKKIKQYIENFGAFIIPFIQYANMIVVNNIDNCNKEVLEQEIREIKKLNPKAYILKVNNRYILKATLKGSRVIDNGYLKKIKIKISNYKRNKKAKNV